MRFGGHLLHLSDSKIGVWQIPSWAPDLMFSRRLNTTPEGRKFQQIASDGKVLFARVDDSILEWQNGWRLVKTEKLQDRPQPAVIVAVAGEPWIAESHPPVRMGFRNWDRWRVRELRSGRTLSTMTMGHQAYYRSCPAQGSVLYLGLSAGGNAGQLFRIDTVRGTLEQRELSLRYPEGIASHPTEPLAVAWSEAGGGLIGAWPRFHGEHFDRKWLEASGDDRYVHDIAYAPSGVLFAVISAPAGFRLMQRNVNRTRERATWGRARAREQSPVAC
ncbi:MAG: hypothetical protein ACI8W8_000631 [Rhodothermales bacterium]